MRVWLWFTGTSALLQYQLMVHQMFIQLVVGDKPQFDGQAFYFPAGGGIWGFDSATPAMVNGTPEQTAILKLGKPVPIPARQHFTIVVDLYDTGTTSVRTTYLNASQSIGMREVKVLVDGLHTRDVL